ncbi:hypothetical protein VPH35_072495 [Triticum aestivum]
MSAARAECRRPPAEPFPKPSTRRAGKAAPLPSSGGGGAVRRLRLSGRRLRGRGHGGGCAGPGRDAAATRRVRARAPRALRPLPRLAPPRLHRGQRRVRSGGGSGSNLVWPHMAASEVSLAKGEPAFPPPFRFACLISGRHEFHWL